MMKYIPTETVAGIELEYSKKRIGTKCKCCNREFKDIADADYNPEKHCPNPPIPTYTKSCGIAYVCTECISEHPYGMDLQNRQIVDGKLTAGKYRFAVEIEANYFNEYPDEVQKVNAYLAAQWGLQPSHDCTVSVEYHMSNRVNFHGLKDFMEDVSKVVELDAPNCGHHINISKIDWTAGDMNKIRMNGFNLFHGLAVAMAENEGNTIKVFGRSFGGWAQNDNFFQHGSWLNLDNPYHLEFRIPHFKNSNQFFYCVNFCRDCVDILDNWLQGAYTTEKASAAIVKKFAKYADGKANCQRPERNKVGR